MIKETIEDGANKESRYLSDWEDKETWKWGFEEGAKWQQKRSYSEENLLGNGENSLDNFLLNSPLHSQEERELIMETIFKWFEQFKKK